MSKELSLLETRIEELFDEEPFNQVDEELFRWLIFAYFQNGSGIKDLNKVDFERFKDKLTLLVDAVYQLHQARTKIEKR